MHRNSYYFFVYLVIIQAILLCLHWFIYTTAIVLLRVEYPPLAAFLKYAIFSLAFGFVLASVLASKYKNRTVRWLYTAAATWMGLFYFLFMASFLGWIAFDFFIPPDAARIFTTALFILSVVIAIRGVVGAFRPGITNISFEFPNLPQNWQGKTAVFISDIHAGQIRGRRFVNYVVDRINEINPEIVLIGGDFYDGLAVDLGAVTEPLSRLKAPRGTYFVTGNHERYGGGAPYPDILKKFGVKVLKNETVNVAGLWISGVDYADTHKTEDGKKILEEMCSRNPKGPHIFLRHAPEHICQTEKTGFSVQLSGHTHGGQVFPLNIISSIIYRGHNYGLKRYKNLSVYTSSGAGTWGPPLRVGTKSEIVAIKLLSRLA
jgi:hypothetical protein